MLIHIYILVYTTFNIYIPILYLGGSCLPKLSSCCSMVIKSPISEAGNRSDICRILQISLITIYIINVHGYVCDIMLKDARYLTVVGSSFLAIPPKRVQFFIFIFQDTFNERYIYFSQWFLNRSKYIMYICS